MKIKSTVWISCIVIPLALVVLLLRSRVERTAVAQEAAQATEKREAGIARLDRSDRPDVSSSAPNAEVADPPKTGSDDVAIPEVVEPLPAKPTTEPSNVKPDDFNVPLATKRPIGSIRKAEVRLKDVPIQIKRAEVHFTEAYRLKNQDAARIAGALKKLVPELDITYDPATESVVIQEMTPKMREFVTEVIQRLSAARQEPLTPQPSTPGAMPALSRVLSASPPVLPRNPTPVIKRDRNEMQDEVRRAFEARQESLRKEVAEFRSRIDRLVQTIKDRERSKDAIIERRVEELLNPNLRWDGIGSNILSASGATPRNRPNRSADQQTPMTPKTTSEVAPAERDQVSNPIEPLQKFDPNPLADEAVNVGIVSLFDVGHGQISVSLKDPGSTKVGDVLEIARPIADDQNSLTYFGRIRVIEVEPYNDFVIAVLTHSTRQLVENRWDWMQPERGDRVTRAILNETRPNASSVARTKELEFLSQYPRFSGLSLDMTETQFRVFLEQQKLTPQLSIPRGGQLNYSVPLGDGHRLTVMFGLDGKCRGIERISGDGSSPSPSPPSQPQATNETAKQALIRAAEARRKLADHEVEHAEAALKLIEDSNKKVPGAVANVEVVSCRLDVLRANANREIADAEVEAAKTGVDIRRTDKPPVTLDSATAGVEKTVAKIFALKHASAVSVAKTLQELASERPFSAKIAAETASNSVIVFANPDDMHVIEAIMIRLDMASESPSPKAASQPSSDSSETPDEKSPGPVKEPALRIELLDREKEDQSARAVMMKWMQGKRIDGRAITAPKLVAEFDQIGRAIEKADRKNTERMKEIVAEHGWPGKSLVGMDGANAAWLLVQHADRDLAFQKECLALMRAMPSGEIEPKNVAYLTDRTLTAEKQQQLYGTQLVPTPEGDLQPLPIEDEAKIDERRASMGLEPLKDYLARARSELSQEKKEPTKKDAP